MVPAVYNNQNQMYDVWIGVYFISLYGKHLENII